MVKATIREILGATNGLKEISTLELPVKTSYWLARSIDKINKELKIFNEKAAELREKYAKKDSDGNVVKNEDGTIDFGDNAEAIDKEYGELLDIEVEVDFKVVNLADVDCNVKPAVLIGLEKFITYEEKQPEA